MKAWRFLVPPDGARSLPGPTPGTTVTYAGCLAVMAAPDEATARAHVAAWAETSGADVRWLEVAQVREIEITDGTLLAFVMF
jgi:hypothetical protein